MGASWAAVVVGAAMFSGTVTGWVWRAARREGKVDAILAQLTAITADHEARLRDLSRHR